MNNDQSRPNAPDEAPAPGAAAASPAVRYAGGASLNDVMFDQLEYLLDHGNSECPPVCVECKRLEQVKYWLLAPFDSAG